MKEKEEKPLDNLKAPLPVLTGGKAEVSDGDKWFTLATENFVVNTIGDVPPCIAGTVTQVGNITAVYANGVAGVGATLTNSGMQAAIVIDGVALAVGQRVLIKDQTIQFQNGVYTVTTVGTPVTNWVLTRATDYDSASQMIRGRSVRVISGTVNAITDWMLTSIVVTVGTDALTFALLAKSGVVSVLGTANQIIVTVVNNVATISIAPNPIIPGTASITIPTGTTGQRPGTPTIGMIRFNTNL